MRGVDIPGSEIELARQFLEVSQGPVPEQFTTTKDGLIRMLAWYGVLRRNAKGTSGWTSKRHEDRETAPTSEKERH